MKKKSIGQWILIFASLELLISVVLNGFEVVSSPVFRVLVVIGILLDVIALVCISRTNEF